MQFKNNASQLIDSVNNNYLSINSNYEKLKEKNSIQILDKNDQILVPLYKIPHKKHNHLKKLS